MLGRYLSDLIPEKVFASWIKGKKVVIQGPTGIGKNYFILKVFAMYCRRFRRKVLILCNRKMLKSQYRYDLAEIYPRYFDMDQSVAVLTYQQLSEILKSGQSIEPLIDEFDVVVCDEAHYFYADADFNGLGTYVLLQALVKVSFFKTMIFMSATLEEILPLLKRTLYQCEKKMKSESPELDIEKYCYRDEIYDFKYLEDYSRFSCHFYCDEESLVAAIANSDKKTVIFIDDTIKAQLIKNQLENKFGVPKEEVKLLSSQILDENPNDSFVKKLAIGNKLPVKILITTSVLDNGVSIHDSEVGNVVIATESRISFIQMLGRIRGENSDDVRLFIYPRESAYYEKRVLQYEEKMNCFNRISPISLQKRHFGVLANGWYGNDENAEFIRNAIVQTMDENEYYSINFYSRMARIKAPNPVMAVNTFAKEKIGDTLQVQQKFLRLSYQEDVAAVAKEQLKWMGKDPDELVIWGSTYFDERKKLLKEKLLEIKEYSNEMLKNAKEAIAKEFRKDILSDMNLKANSFETKKLIQICERYGLTFEQGVNSDKRAVYSVTIKEILEKEDI